MLLINKLQNIRQNLSERKGKTVTIYSWCLQKSLIRARAMGTVGRANPVLIPDDPSLIRALQECRARCKPWALPDMTPKQKQTKKISLNKSDNKYAELPWQDAKIWMMLSVTLTWFEFYNFIPYLKTAKKHPAFCSSTHIFTKKDVTLWVKNKKE